MRKHAPHRWDSPSLVRDRHLRAKMPEVGALEQWSFDLSCEIVVAPVANDPCRQNVLDIAERLGNDVFYGT
ncbi:hypothetical protein AGR4B_pAt20346 [Agrobacterium tumefaciens str. CFBP 5621]|nr:hypothetical protein AGR4B_pAt20346 [Agrobacterium tumefaciens str. CFBP 5621]